LPNCFPIRICDEGAEVVEGTVYAYMEL
jgi:hypothetical protein